MHPTQFRLGHYWKTNDPADLTFNEAGTKPPNAIRCFNMQDFLNHGECRDVLVETLEFLGSGTFGEARPSVASTRWTGDSHRYGIYRNRAGVYKNGVIVVECHGGGMFGYAFDNLVAGETWEYVARNLSPETIWNLCYQIAGAYRTARDAEKRLLSLAFLEGRMKKRRKNNKVYVEIVAAERNRDAAA